MPANTPKFTVEQMVNAINDSHGFIFLAAKKLGCHARTVLNYKRKYKAIQDACEQKKGEQLDGAEATLLTALSEGQPWAVCFYLKTQGKARGYVERTEVANVSDDEIDAAAAELLGRLARRRKSKAAEQGRSNGDDGRPGGRPNSDDEGIGPEPRQVAGEVAPLFG